MDENFVQGAEQVDGDGTLQNGFMNGPSSYGDADLAGEYVDKVVSRRVKVGAGSGRPVVNHCCGRSWSQQCRRFREIRAR